MAQGLFLFVQKTSVKDDYDFSKILENHKQNTKYYFLSEQFWSPQ